MVEQQDKYYDALLEALRGATGQAACQQFVAAGGIDNVSGACLAKQLIRAIDRAPLYSVSEPAQLACQAHQVHQRGKGAAHRPTIPERGATLSVNGTAGFMCPMDTPGGQWSSSRISPADQARTYYLFVGCGRSSTADMAFVIGLFTVENYVTGLLPIETFVLSIAGRSGRHISVCTLQQIAGTPRADAFTILPNTLGVLTQDPISAVSMKPTMESCVDRCSWFLALLDFIDQPTHYVVEERPAHIPVDRKPSKPPAPAASRERWIILDPEEVKVKYAARTNKPETTGTHASPRLHLRRGHTKTLTHERYTYKRGTVINIRPTWVGDREWDNGRLKYRVVSRAGAEADQA